MNNVSLCGKIIRFKELGAVTYFTMVCRDGKNTEYIDVTTFDTKFFNLYFTVGSWISIRGRLHKNPKRDYQLEVIAEKLYFAGNAPLEVNTTTGEITTKGEIILTEIQENETDNPFSQPQAEQLQL